MFCYVSHDWLRTSICHLYELKSHKVVLQTKVLNPIQIPQSDALVSMVYFMHIHMVIKEV